MSVDNIVYWRSFEIAKAYLDPCTGFVMNQGAQSWRVSLINQKFLWNNRISFSKENTIPWIYFMSKGCLCLGFRLWATRWENDEWNSERAHFVIFLKTQRQFSQKSFVDNFQQDLNHQLCHSIVFCDLCDIGLSSRIGFLRGRTS